MHTPFAAWLVRCVLSLLPSLPIVARCVVGSDTGGLLQRLEAHLQAEVVVSPLSHNVLYEEYAFCLCIVTYYDYVVGLEFAHLCRTH